MSGCLQSFTARVQAALADVFAKSQQKNELNFALSFHPECVGLIDPKWSSVIESFRALEDLLNFLGNDTAGVDHRQKVRLALGIYAHLSTAKLFYTPLKSLLNGLAGLEFSLIPFTEPSAISQQRSVELAYNPALSAIYQQTQTLDLAELQSVIAELVHAPLVIAYQTADYIVGADGLRLFGNAPNQTTISFEEFQNHLEKLVNFFVVEKRLIDAAIAEYANARSVHGKLTATGTAADYLVEYNPGTKAFKVSLVN